MENKPMPAWQFYLSFFAGIGFWGFSAGVGYAAFRWVLSW